MIKSKYIGAVAGLLMSVAALIVCLVYVNPSFLKVFSLAAAPSYVAAMDKKEILDIEIIADDSEWENMLENATMEEYIPASIVINGLKIENVGIRPKGNSSLSMVAQDDTTDRFSFKIEFDHYITGQTWLGLDKLVVNNMQGDATYMKEYLTYDIMDYAGVDAPLYSFAGISVNDELWGFYLAVEALDDSYAKRLYGNNHGKLYKPESMGMRGEGRMNGFINNMENDNAFEGAQQGNAPQQENLQAAENPPTEENMPQAQDEGGNRRMMRGGPMGRGMDMGGVSLLYTDDEISGYKAIFDNAVFDTSGNDKRRVIKALKKLSQGEDLEKVVNVDAAMKYFAAHTVVVNLDSYVSNMGHNYYLYEKDGQLNILPWDYNLAFGGFQSRGASEVVNFPIDTPVSGVSLDDRPLLGKLLEIPEHMDIYHETLSSIVYGYFESGLFEQTVEYVNELISPYVEEDPSAFYDYEAYKTAQAELKKLGLLRAESIKGQLDGSIPATTEAQASEPDKLVDSSSINLQALGSLGGGGGAFLGMPEGIDMNIMRQVMEIIMAANGGELSEEQHSQLSALGLTDEQITEIKTTMTQNGFEGRVPGGMGNMRRNEGAPGAMPNPPGFGQEASSKTSTISGDSWMLIGFCILLLLFGMLFVVLFKRRRNS